VRITTATAQPLLWSYRKCSQNVNCLCGSCNLISVGNREIRTATAFHGELWPRFTTRKTDILISSHAPPPWEGNNSQNCAYYNRIFTVYYILPLLPLVPRYLLSSRVHPSVCMPHASIAPKRLKLGSRKPCRTIAQGL